jgi:hypothetical protein
MRVGDFGVDVVAVQDGEVREIESGHVLAKAGTVYGLRLTNFGPLRCAADIEIDGKLVSRGGLVLDPYSVVTLERPIDDRETGRFTVIAEGNERVFGPDGGRDNPNLGLIEVRFRRELPRERSDARPLPDVTTLPVPVVRTTFSPDAPTTPSPRTVPAPSRPMAPPEWTPPGFQARASAPQASAVPSALRSVDVPRPAQVPSELIERAAGTGLTGHSAQRFIPVSLGPLEAEATVIRLRLVIASEEALSAPRPLRPSRDAPERPAARP